MKETATVVAQEDHVRDLDPSQLLAVCRDSTMSLRVSPSPVVSQASTMSPRVSPSSVVKRLLRHQECHRFTVDLQQEIPYNTVVVASN